MKANSKPGWPVGFAASRMRDFYVREAYWLAFQIIQKAQQLAEMYPDPRKEFYISADIRGLDIAYSLLSDAAKLYDLFKPQRDKPVHAERAAFLAGLVSGVPLRALPEKKVRNTIEHFGEYLDDLNFFHSQLAPKKRYVVGFNFIFSHLEPAVDPELPFPVCVSFGYEWPVVPLRVYVTSTRILYNFDWAVDIGALTDEAKAIVEALRAHTSTERPEDWTSMLLVLGPDAA